MATSLVVEEAGVLHPERTTDHGQATGKPEFLLYIAQNENSFCTLTVNADFNSGFSPYCRHFLHLTSSYIFESSGASMS
jgi:hypothetical protein